MSSSLWHDLHFAIRSLKKARSFALWAILALALGIGSTTAIFSVIENTFLDPFPYRDSKRIVVVGIHDSAESEPGGREDERPNASPLGQNSRAVAWLITTTGAPPLASSALKPRPRTIGSSNTEKYSGETYMYPVQLRSELLSGATGIHGSEPTNGQRRRSPGGPSRERRNDAEVASLTSQKVGSGRWATAIWSAAT